MVSRRLLRRLSLSLLVVAGVVYAAAAAYMGLNQAKFIFVADPSPPSLEAAAIPGAAEADFKTADGVTLKGWVAPPRVAGGPVFLYFHGNAGNLMRRAARFRLLTGGGAGLIAFQYRGYGGSEGAPSEAALHADAAALLAETRRRFPGSPVVVFGESLGSGVASRLAGEQSGLAALILDSPFLSVETRASAAYPWLPIPLLIRHPFRSDLAIPKITAPLLVLHGARDRIIPISDGEALTALAPQPKRFIRYPDAGHVGAFTFGAMDDIRKFLKDTAGLDV